MPTANPTTNAVVARQHRYEVVGDQVYDVVEELFLHPCARNAERIAAALNETQEFPWEAMGPTPEEPLHPEFPLGPHLLVRPVLEGPLVCVGWRADLGAWTTRDGERLGVDWSPVSWRRVPACPSKIAAFVRASRGDGAPPAGAAEIADPSKEEAALHASYAVEGETK